MWHVRRLRFESVGHPDARFDPLVMDFTDGDGVPADGVIWLENTGGKTSLLSLAMSTLRPARRDFLGGIQDDKRIEQYVLAGDTAHVAIEWQRLGAQSLFGAHDAPRLVTGQVLQWRDRRVDLDNGAVALQRYFYGFVPTVALSFDTLPIRTDGNRRRPLRDFLDALRAAMAGSDAFRPSTAHDAWHDWLIGRGLDPEVFRYQLRMNADEGAVAAQFQWPSGDAFVKWALSIMVDPELPNGIAKAVDKVRARIAQRESLEVELEFCTHAVTRLRAVAAAHEAVERSTKDLTAAWDAAASLAGQLLANKQASEDAASSARNDAQFADQAARTARAQADHLTRQRTEALIRAAELRVAEDERRLQETQADVETAEATRAAWAATEPLARVARLEHELRYIDLQLRRHEAETQPLRDAADHAARSLARKLTDLRDRAAAEHTAAGAKEKALNSQLDQVKQQTREANADLNNQTAAEARLSERVDMLDQAVAAATDAGWLRPDEDPAAAATRLRVEAERADTELHDALRARDAATNAQAEARRALEDAFRSHADAEQRLNGAKRVSAELDDERSTLERDPQLIAVAQAEPVDLWADPRLLLDRLATLAQEAATARLDVELQVAADRRAVTHLQRERLLPPSIDVEKVLDLLERGGVRTAYSGWQVLRDTRSTAERAGLIDAHPELASGVLLSDPNELTRARSILGEAGVTLPVVIAPILALSGTTPPGDRLVVPGPAALHNEDAAAEELGRHQERLADADRAIDAHRAQERTALETIARYQQFLNRWPGHARDDAYQALTQATEEAATADAHLAAARHRRDQADAAQRASESAAEGARATAGQAQQIATKAGDLNQLWAQRAGWEAERSTLRARKQAAEARLADLRNQASELEDERRAQAEYRGRAATQRDGATAQLRTLALTVTREGAVPDEPLEVLVHAHTVAQQQVRATRPDSALLDDQDRHRATKAERDAELGRFPAGVIERAKTLLTTVDGQTPETRAEAMRRAGDEAAQRRERVGELREALKRAVRLLDDRQRPTKDRAALDEQPATWQAAESLAERLAEKANSANVERGQWESESEALKGQAEDHARDAQHFDEAAKDLLQALRDHQDIASRSADAVKPTSAWPGKSENVAAARRDAVEQVNDHAKQRTAAIQERTAALAGVDRIVNIPKYAQLLAESPLRDRLTSDPEGVRAATAARLADQLELRASTITKDLAEIDRHRATIAQLLVGRVRDAIQQLRHLQNQSRLPDGLEEWTGRTYLTIRHADLPQDLHQLTARVLTVIDRLTHSGSAAGRSDGMALLFDALLAAVGPDGFSVGILKPHIRLRNVRVPVQEIRRFSGGQKVTAALVIFAALVRMREANRHRELHRSESGAPLLLDNPIGKASAGTLIEVQRRVAARCGLQLIYTTGVADLGALGQFTCVLRLDGKQNLRTGALHVTGVEKTILIDGVRLVQRVDGGSDG